MLKKERQNSSQNPLKLLWAVGCQHFHRGSLHAEVDNSAINNHCWLEIGYVKL